jgi:sugar phosphate isomerase/epimerase
MELSVLLTSLPLPLREALHEAVRLGFRCVDLVAQQERPTAECEALAESGLRVRCVALGRDLQDGARLDAADVAVRRRAVDQVQAQLSDAARLGAEFAYVVPCARPENLAAFADACAVLGAAARRRMLWLCIEHMPGTALASAAATLDWLRTSGLEQVRLLLDVGHCLMSGEDPAHVVRAAQDTLAYVHLDDNDGQGDLHWPLLSGRLSAAMLRELFAALRAIGFGGGVALELNRTLSEPLQNLAASKGIVDEILMHDLGKFGQSPER